MAFKPAYREQVRLRLALMGLSGSGKTMSSLATAASLSYEIRKRGGEGRIAVVDTERESVKLYAMSRGERRKYDAMSVDDGYALIKQIRKFPIDVDLMTSFSPLAYVDKINDAAREGYDITVLDSISHAWAGTGGALERKGKIEDRGGNSWTAWRTITPEHNAFVDGMLGTPSHLIVTLRMKSQHAMELENGKQKIVDLGIEEIQRDGLRYEFTLVGQIDQDHVMTVVKTRLDGVIANGDRFDRPGDEFGRRIYGWVNDGDEPAPKVEAPPAPAKSTDSVHPDVAKLYMDINQAESVPRLQALVAFMAELVKAHPAIANEAKRRYVERKAKLNKDNQEEKEYIESKQPEEVAAREHALRNVRALDAGASGIALDIQQDIGLALDD